jgi:hypothetical protein
MISTRRAPMWQRRLSGWACIVITVVHVVVETYPIGREVIVDATGISAVGRPDRPYLTP